MKLGEDVRVAELGRELAERASETAPHFEPLALCFGSLGIDRSVVVGSRLFTLSQTGVLASDLNSLADRGWAAFS